MAKNAGKIAIGTVIAAAAGYVAGILTAPKSGKETRDEIKNTASKTITDAEKKLKKLHTELDRSLKEANAHVDTLKGKAKAEVEKAIDKTTAAKEKARQALSAVHEGDAEEKELQRAIEDADEALAHLKKLAVGKVEKVKAALK